MFELREGRANEIYGVGGQLPGSDVYNEVGSTKAILFGFVFIRSHIGLRSNKETFTGVF